MLLKKTFLSTVTHLSSSPPDQKKWKRSFQMISKNFINIKVSASQENIGEHRHSCLKSIPYPIDLLLSLWIMAYFLASKAHKSLPFGLSDFFQLWITFCLSIYQNVTQILKIGFSAGFVVALKMLISNATKKLHWSNQCLENWLKEIAHFESSKAVHDNLPIYLLRISNDLMNLL